ncbi:PREDICTED: UPF0725 protein At4g11700-like [Camelina sativa]|uniref:UPF0725 protein At4g11700-like n=1 Tax=Camelina sativa TaxID=90675 RepID=A0ABM1R047_CAMSA|nr:PREDICTED: UPF0725 protein At4g11700-like [Camelina sativa]
MNGNRWGGSVSDIKLLSDFLPDLPPVNPFQDDTSDRFYVLKKSEVKKNDWIRLYLELAVATTNRTHSKFGMANLKILRVAMETPREHVLPITEGLGAYDAIFYIRYTDSCKARAGDDVDRVAVVRRILDDHTEVFRLVGRTHSIRLLGNGESQKTAVHGSEDIEIPQDNQT